MTRPLGSIDVTKQGRFRARVTLPDGRRTTVGVFATRELAEREIGTASRIILTEAPAVGMTLAQWGETYLTKRELSGDIADAQGDWSRWRNHIASDEIAGYVVRGITPRDVFAWLDRTRSKGLARQTVVNAKNLLSGCLDAAFVAGHVKANAANGVKVPREKRPHTPWTVLSLEEQHAVLMATNERLRPIVGVAIGSGIRAGELAALRLADVAITGPHPHMVVRYGGPPAQPTKGGRPRTVPLFGFALTAAEAWLDGLRSYAPANPKRLMFPRERGGFRNPDHVFEWETWKGILERAGITRPFRWHDLRHTCASSLVSGLWGRAWSLEETRELLGHTSVTTTERYAHLAGTALERAAEATPLRPFSGQPALLSMAGKPRGREGIRTPGPLAESAVFKTAEERWDVGHLGGDGRDVAGRRRAYVAPRLVKACAPTVRP